MKFPLIPLFVASAVFLPGIACAQIKNGGFEDWSADAQEAWADGWNADAPQLRGPGLAPKSTYSAIVRDKHFINQKLTPANSRDFQIRLVVAIPDSDLNEFEQPFIFTLQSQGADGKTVPWIQLRLDRDSGTGPLRLRARGATEWSETLRGPGVIAINGATYDEATNTFTYPKPYQLTVTYSGAANTYSVAIGPLGQKPAVITGLKHYNNPTRPAGLTGVMFYAYNKGFALDDLTLISPSPKP